MKRKTVLKRLGALIPSLHYTGEIHCPLPTKENGEEDIRAALIDFDRYSIESGKVVINELVWDIPEDRGVGIEMECDGEKYVSKKDWDIPIRMCGLDILDFGAYGNTHCYGEVRIKGTSWVNEKGQSVYRSDMKHPDVGDFHFKLRRILREEDITPEMGDWEGSEPGQVTERFQTVTSLILQCIWVVLSRVQGPLVLQSKPLYCVQDRKDCLAFVDEKDNVTLRSDILNILKRSRKS